MYFYKDYDRTRAQEYARRWATGRNPLFFNFTGLGGDCTNFVSQCLLAGCCVQNFTPDFGWYYLSPEDRAAAFTGVEYFWNFMTGTPEYVSRNGGTGPFGRAVNLAQIEVGDVVQLGDRMGDFYHTLIVSGFRGAEPLLASHSNDVYDRPLSSYAYGVARFLHIEGVRIAQDIPDCFEGLIEGVSLPVQGDIGENPPPDDK